MNNEPAFPSHGSMGEMAYQGMTLRDYFAAKAVLGLLASGNVRQHVNITVGDEQTAFAQAAYMIADAMLKAREAK